MKLSNRKLSQDQEMELLQKLEGRFEANKDRHPWVSWPEVKECVKAKPDILWTLEWMEASGGEPDIMETREGSKEIVFFDFSKESPMGRRSLCYDESALASRKKNKPQHSALGLATEMGVEMLDEADYRTLQKISPVDLVSSSWIKTPDEIRRLGGALFGDYRYATIFIYHNGAESYYASRGFRSKLVIQ